MRGTIDSKIKEQAFSVQFWSWTSALRYLIRSLCWAGGQWCVVHSKWWSLKWVDGLWIVVFDSACVAGWGAVLRQRLRHALHPIGSSLVENPQSTLHIATEHRTSQRTRLQRRMLHHRCKQRKEKEGYPCLSQTKVSQPWTGLQRSNQHRDPVSTEPIPSHFDVLERQLFHRPNQLLHRA